MEVKEWIELCLFAITVIGIIIGMNSKWEKQQAKITLLETTCMSAINMTNSKLSNTNKDLSQLQERVSNHKNKFENNFDLLESRLDTKDALLHKKIDELKDLIIERISK